MFGPIRINAVLLFCSCIGHAALLGGFLLSIQGVQSRGHSPAVARPALVMTLIPLEDLAEPDPGAAPALPPGRAVAALRKIPIASGAPATGRPAAVGRIGASVVDDPNPARVASAGPHAEAQSSDYQHVLYELVARNARYPAAARRLDLAGVTTLAFRLDRLGTLTGRWIRDSSGSQMLDDAALAALERAQPFPPIPADLPDTLEFLIEIDSSVMRQSSDRADG